MINNLPAPWELQLSLSSKTLLRRSKLSPATGTSNCRQPGKTIVAKQDQFSLLCGDPPQTRNGHGGPTIARCCPDEKAKT